MYRSKDIRTVLSNEASLQTSLSHIRDFGPPQDACLACGKHLDSQSHFCDPFCKDLWTLREYKKYREQQKLLV